MARKRKIRKIGNSYFIKLVPIDLKDFELNIGDYVVIDDIVKINSPHEE